MPGVKLRPRNRVRTDTGGRIPPEQRWLSADRSATGRAARAHVGDAGTVLVDIAADHAATTWNSRDSGIGGDRPCLRFDRRSLTHRMILDYEAGGGVQTAYSDTEGEAWSVATTITSAGAYPTFAVTPTGAQHHYWVDGGAVKTKATDANGNTLIAVRTVVASGVADDALAAWHNADTGDLFLQHRDGAGAIITLRSVDDGLNFA